MSMQLAQEAHEAAFKGSVSQLRAALEQGVVVSCRDSSGFTCLHHAAYRGHADVVALLLEHGAPLDPPDAQGCTPLHASIMGGPHTLIAEALLDAGASATVADGQGATALHKAAWMGDAALVTRLGHVKGVSVETALPPSGGGDTALHLAAGQGHAEAIHCLVRAGASALTTNDAGAAATHLAAAAGHAEALAALLEPASPRSPAAPVDPRLAKDGSTPLLLAAFHGHAAVVDQLLAHGASLAAVTTPVGATALHLAAVAGHAHVVRTLVRAGAAVNDRDANGMTPLHWAAGESQGPVIDTLVELGASVLTGDNLQRLPRDLARVDATRQLLLRLAVEGEAKDGTRRASASPVGRDGLHVGGAGEEAKDEASLLADEATNRRTDAFGFFLPDDEVGDRMTQEETDFKASEPDRELKWASMTKKWDHYSKKKSANVRKHVLLGVPNSFRGLAWKLIAGASESRKLHPGLYDKLLQSDGVQVKDIVKDLHRTFPDHDMFAERGGSGQRSLYNVLKAVTVQDPELGYCQGMGFVCALFLMYMEEEDAFWLLMRIIQDYNLRELWSPGFPALRQCFSVLDMVVYQMNPKLYRRLKSLELLPGGNMAIYSHPWLLTLFLNALPWVSCLRIWDLFLLDGFVVIYAAAYAILKVLEPQIMGPGHAEDIVQIMMRPNISHIVLAETLADVLPKVKTRVKKIDKEFVRLERQASRRQLRAMSPRKSGRRRSRKEDDAEDDDA